MNAIMYGAGNIGRGFIAKRFFLSGMNTAFIDVNVDLVDKLNAAGKYPVYVTRGDHYEAEWVENISAINGRDADAVVNAIGNQVTQNVADIATNANDIGAHTTAIGANSADIAVLQDGKIDLDTVAAPGTIDGDLYAAIVALGWENDVIE